MLRLKQRRPTSTQHRIKPRNSNRIAHHPINTHRRTMSKTPEAKLTALRGQLDQHNIKAYIIPTADAHISEYVSESDMRRAYISNFTGSAGTAVVTHDEALLWTDGRYFLQAAAQLPPSWKLMKQGLPETPNIDSYLASTLQRGDRVGFDPFLMQYSQFSTFKDTLSNKGISFVPITTSNLVDEVWGKDKPALPSGTIRLQKYEDAGETVDNKLSKLTDALKKNNAHFMVLCALDEIAWVFNLRGSDISFNPVFLSYAIITADGDAHLFVDDSKFNNDAKDAIKQHSNITIHKYTDIVPFLATLRPQLDKLKAAGLPYKAWVDQSKSNTAIFAALGYGVDDDDTTPEAREAATLLHKVSNPVGLLKAVKNDVEITGMKNAHIRDGAAMVKFLSWFETQYETLPSATASSDVIASSPWNEYTLAEHLESIRTQQPRFVGLSFDTISSIGPNGAIIHYKPEADTASPLVRGKVFLLDSGAQFLDGTTDITRTFYIPDNEHAPQPTEFQRNAFTRVLQGHIALARAVFPPQTMGPTLDILARKALWEAGLNYLHGTGHGVGSFLNVHEGPQGICSMNRGGSPSQTAIVPGMVLSNEPGYYHDGEFGIRIENLIYCIAKDTAHTPLYLPDGSVNPKAYLGFENLTMVPIDRTLIDVSALTKDEIVWLDTYHREIYDKVSPLVQDDAVALQWLEKNTKPLV